jgi:adenosylhomocysteine nucleosidase
MIAVAAALPEELSNLRRQMIVEKHLAGPSGPLRQGTLQDRDVLLVQTGMGKKKAEMTTRFVLARYSPSALVSIGFAGALVRELKVGDVVICSALVCAANSMEEEDESEPLFPDERLLDLATQALEGTGLRFQVGGGVTTMQVIASSEGKHELGQAFQAHIVDMESYWMARIAAEHKIPFVTLRAISDTPQDRLPPFDRLLTHEGRLHWKDAAVYFCRNPGQLIALISLARNMQYARKNLATAVDCLLAIL